MQYHHALALSQILSSACMLVCLIEGLSADERGRGKTSLCCCFGFSLSAFACSLLIELDPDKLVDSFGAFPVAFMIRFFFIASIISFIFGVCWFITLLWRRYVASKLWPGSHAA